MRRPTVLSLFSGIGGFDLGLERAGFEVIGQCDNDPFCNKVLEKHWPGVPRYDDVRRISNAVCLRGRDADADTAHLAPDLVCGGFPCQDLSVAGKRAGLAGERSGLWFEFHRVLSELRPTFGLIENVPGLLSACGCDICTAIGLRIGRHTRSRGLKSTCQCSACDAGRAVQRHHAGLAFSVVLAGLGQLWPAVGWAVLDSQHFGVPQRRRRVYIVGGPSRESVQQILSLCEGGDWHPQTSRASGQDVAYALASSVRGTGDGSGNAWNSAYVANEVAHAASAQPNASYRADSDTYIPALSGTLNAHDGEKWGSNQWVNEDKMILSHTLSADGLEASEDGTGRDTSIVSVRTAQTSSNGWGVNEEGTAYTLDGSEGQPVLQSTVRRLTPVECERLQGFPDDWTRLDDNTPDGPRYKACGNAVTVPVIEYLGLRMRDVILR